MTMMTCWIGELPDPRCTTDGSAPAGAVGGTLLPQPLIRRLLLSNKAIDITIRRRARLILPPFSGAVCETVLSVPFSSIATAQRQPTKVTIVTAWRPHRRIGRCCLGRLVQGSYSWRPV